MGVILDAQEGTDMEQTAGAFAGLTLAWGFIAIFTAVKEGWREARMWGAVALISGVLCVLVFAVDFAMYMKQQGAW